MENRNLFQGLKKAMKFLLLGIFIGFVTDVESSLTLTRTEIWTSQVLFLTDTERSSAK